VLAKLLGFDDQYVEQLALGGELAGVDGGLAGEAGSVWRRHINYGITNNTI